MDENPYQPGRAPTPAAHTRPTWWLVGFGLAALLAAAMLAGYGIYSLVLTFNEIASTPTAPQPADLADGVSTSVSPLSIATAVGLLGLVLIVVGLIIRQPVDSSGRC